MVEKEIKKTVSYSLKIDNVKKVKDISYKKDLKKSEVVDKMIEEFKEEELLDG